MSQARRTVRARAIARRAERPSMLPWIVLALALSLAAAANAQVANQTSNPPVTRDAPAPGTPGLSAQGSGPQMAAPAPGANGGKGLITPPNVDPGIAKGSAAPGAYPMPVIPPPGAPGGNPAVQPK